MMSDAKRVMRSGAGAEAGALSDAVALVVAARVQSADVLAVWQLLDRVVKRLNVQLADALAGLTAGGRD